MALDPTAALRAAGVYVTPQRLAVLRVVSERAHATADEVVQAVRAEIGSASRQSVFDALNTLTGLGLLRRIQPMGSPARYESRTGDNHHHLICRSCGRVVDIDCAVGERPCLTAAESHGFAIDEAEVIYWGHCPTCLGPAPNEPARSRTRPRPPQGAS